MLFYKFTTHSFFKIQLMSRQQGKYSNQTLQTTKFVDIFGGQLNELKKFIYSPPIMHTKIFEFVKEQYLSTFRTPEGVILLLCLLFIGKERLSEASRFKILSQVGKWKENICIVTQLIEEEIKKNQISREREIFYQILKNQECINKLKNQYEHFLSRQSSFIYKQSEKIWSLLQFQNLFSQKIIDSTEDQQQINIQFKKLWIQLTKKQNQLRFYQHIQDSMLEPHDSLQKEEAYKNMMKIETLLPLSKQKTNSSSSLKSYPCMRSGFTVKEMMIMELNLETICLVDRCETYECPYMLFHIPFLYLLAETLSYYLSNYSGLYIYRIFATLCTKANKIKNSSNPQLPEEEISDCIVDFMHFHQRTGRQHARKLGEFLNKHEAKMSTFIPVYFQIFSFHAFQKYQFVDKVFSSVSTIAEKRKRMKDRIQLMYNACEKYNNQSL